MTVGISLVFQVWPHATQIPATVGGPAGDAGDVAAASYLSVEVRRTGDVARRAPGARKFARPGSGQTPLTLPGSSQIPTPPPPSERSRKRVRNQPFPSLQSIR